MDPEATTRGWGIASAAAAALCAASALVVYLAPPSGDAVFPALLLFLGVGLGLFAATVNAFARLPRSQKRRLWWAPVAAVLAVGVPVGFLVFIIQLIATPAPHVPPVP